MSLILAVNAGSSSLKFQLLDMPEENLVTKGSIERIGLSDSISTIDVRGKRVQEVKSVPNHETAVRRLLRRLVSYKIIQSLSEIEGVGHRVLHGGESFNDSVLITDEVIKKIESLSDLAPLHIPANLVGIKA
ncbi:acetate kinase, partial [Sporolactobacillus sp. CQH2019]|nr:acetate kinase [Sporolactobacillus sp. CQH2019]